MTAAGLETREGLQLGLRGRAALGAAAVIGVMGLSVLLVPTSAVIEGGPLAKSWTFVRMGALLLLATWLLRRAGRRWADVGLTRPRRLWAVPLQVILGFLAIYGGVMLAATLLLPALGVERGGFHGLEAIRGDLGAYLYWGLLVSWLPAAFGEELLARGFVLDRLNALFGPGPAAAWLAVLAQAVLFGAAHAYQGLDGVILTGLTGFGLGALFILCGRNLWPCILVHGLIDMGSFTALYLGLAGG